MECHSVPSPSPAFSPNYIFTKLGHCDAQEMRFEPDTPISEVVSQILTHMLGPKANVNPKDYGLVVEKGKKKDEFLWLKSSQKLSAFGPDEVLCSVAGAVCCCVLCVVVCSGDVVVFH